jgi:endogenous inhibitor of DNA gyrase (YacG/DUF329 family)
MSHRATPPVPTCPVCGKPAPVERLAPFCSVRCADVDLGRWLTGQYRIPGPPPEEEQSPDSQGAPFAEPSA